jgi:predicted hydrocarbon binding protein
MVALPASRSVDGPKTAEGGKQALHEGRRRIFPVHFAPGKKLFNIIVRLSDKPGSFRSIIDLLSSRVNLIGTGTYTLNDGTAMFAGFAESLSKNETPEKLVKVVLGSDAAMAVRVVEGTDGLLVDTFHTGFIVDDDTYLLMRRGGLVHMFETVSKMLGTGGDVLLYEEGLAMALQNAETMANNLGIARVRAQMGVLNRFLSTQGWGVLEAKEGSSAGEFTVVVRDCFECAESPDSRKGCSFMRGYLAGGAQATFGKEYDSIETKCILRGAKVCEFKLKPAR